MHNKLTKEILIQFNKDSEAAIDEFADKLQQQFEKLVELSGKNVSPISSYIKELNQELKKSIIIPEEEMKDYLPKEVKE